MSAQLFFELLERWNSPYINHFISPDSIIPNPYDPQSWDRYSYVNNNPLRYTDLTGHMLDDGCNNGECGGSAVGTANMFVKIAKNKPQYRTQALKIIARTYNISLAPGDRWDYAESIVSGGGTTFGWTPSQANDPYKDAKGTQHLASSRPRNG